MGFCSFSWTVPSSWEELPMLLQLLVLHLGHRIDHMEQNCLRPTYMNLWLEQSFSSQALYKSPDQTIANNRFIRIHHCCSKSLSFIRIFLMNHLGAIGSWNNSYVRTFIWKMTKDVQKLQLLVDLGFAIVRCKT